MPSDTPALRPPKEHDHFRWHWIDTPSGREPWMWSERRWTPAGCRLPIDMLEHRGCHYYGPCVSGAIVPDLENEAKALRELCLLLSGAIGKLVADHAQTVRLSPRELTEQDYQLGNTPQFQDGFVSALEMVTSDYLPPLIAVHNQAMTALAALGRGK